MIYDQVDFVVVENQLTGTLPSELAMLSELDFFWVDSNMLTGSLPTWLPKMNNLRGKIDMGCRRVDSSWNLSC